MAGKPVGTAVAVLDLDSNKMEKGLKRVYDSLVNGTIKTEDAFKQLGIKSDSVYEKMRVNAELAYKKITESAKATANDRMRAEEVLVQRYKQLYEQQYGYHKSALDKMSESTLGLGRSFSSLSGVILTAAAALASMRVAEYVKDTAILAARYETLGVVMGVVGNNVGYSKAQMNEYAESVRKMGISMVESRQTVTTMAMAHLDLSKATQLARIAQDAAVIGNTNSSEALKRMVYGIQSAQVEVLRTMGINVSFENSYKKVAEATGRTTESLSEAEKMTIRMNAVLAQGPTITGAYESAMDTAGKKIGSLPRYIEDFQVKMGEAFGPAMVMLVDAATKAMSQMQEEISRPEAQQALAELSKSLAETLVHLGQDLPGKIQKIAGAMQSVADIYNKLPADVVGAAGAGLIGSILFGKGAGLLIAAITLTSSKIDDFKRDHPEIFGLAEPKRYPVPKEPATPKPEVIKPRVDDAPITRSKEAERAAKEYAKALEDTAKEYARLTMAEDDFKKNQIWKDWESRADAATDTAKAVRDLQLAHVDLARQEKMMKDDEASKKKMESDLHAEQRKINSIVKAYEQLSKQLGLSSTASEQYEAGIRKIKAALDANIISVDQYIEAEEALAAHEAKARAESETDLYAQTDGLRSDQFKKAYEETVKAEADILEVKMKALNQYFDKAKWIQTQLLARSGSELQKQANDIAGAFSEASGAFTSLKNMYAEGSDGYKRMEEASKAMIIAQKAAAVVSAVGAIAASAAAPWPAGFVSMVAMAAAMASLLGSIGVSIGGGGSSVGTSYAGTAQAQGANGRLGAEVGVGSESITNSMALLQETYDMEDLKLTRIYNELRDLNGNITGLLTSIVRTGGVGMNIDVSSTEGWAHDMWDQITYMTLGPVGEHIDALTGGLLGSLTGAIFGGATESWVSAMGLSIGAATVQSIMDGADMQVQEFAKISTTTSGGWFGSSSTSAAWYYEEVDDEVQSAINAIFRNMGDTLIYIAEGLGQDVQEVLDYVFEATTVDLNGMSTDEMNNALSEYFSGIMDTAVNDLFGELLYQYQKIDEGLMETALRLIRDKEVVLSILEMTGQAFEGTDEEAIALSESLIALAGDLEALADAASAYYDNFTTEAQKQTDLSNQLYDTMASMNMILPDTREGYADLVALMAATMDTTTEAGMAAQENYVALLMLADASDKYYTTLEDAQQTIDDTIIYYQDMMGLTSALGSEIDGVTEYFEKAYEAAVLLGMSEEELALIRQGEAEVVSKLIADYMDSYSDWVSSTTGTASDVQANLQSIIDYYDQMEADLLAIGAAQDVIVELHRQEQAVLEYTANVIMADMLTTMMEINGYSTQLSTDLRYIAESYSKMLQDAYQLVSMDLASPMSMAVIAASGGIAILNRLNKSRTEQEQANINSVADASQARYDAESEEIKKLTSQIQDLESIIDAVVNKIQDLKYSQFNLALPAQKMPQAAEDYQALLDAAKTGDSGAVNKYLGFVDTYLQTAQDRYKSSAEYQAIYRQVMEDLEGVKASAQKQLTLDQQLLMEINSKMGEIAGSSGSTASNTAAIAEQETVLNNIAASMLGAAEFLEEFVGKYLETMPVIAGLAQLIADKMTSMADLLHDIQKYITDGMNNGFAADGFITSLINSMISEIGSGLLNIGELLTSAGFGNIGAVLTSIGSKMDTQINNYSELVQWLKDLNEKGATLVYFGEMMVYYGFTDLGNKIVELGTKLSTMGAAISKPLAALKDAMTGWITVKQITDQDIFDSLNFGNKTVAGWAYDTSVNAYHTAYGVAALNSSLQVPGYSEGGIASGPESGYPVILHGTEAITPINKMSAGRGAGLGEDPEVKQILTNILAAQNKKQRVTIVLDNGRELSGYVKSIADGLDQTRYDKQVSRRTYR